MRYPDHRPPRPLAQSAQLDWSWQHQGACRGHDTATFFAPDLLRGVSKERYEAAAKAICAACPVIQACLHWALTVGEPHGIWGGTSAAERHHLHTTARRSESRS